MSDKCPDDDARLLKTVEWIEGHGDEKISKDDLVYMLHWFQTENHKLRKRVEELEAENEQLTEFAQQVAKRSDKLQRKYEALSERVQGWMKVADVLAALDITKSDISEEE